MFDYLVKFNKLPQELRDEVSTPLVMAAIDELEERFRVNLATVIMRVMVKEISFDDLKQFFIEEFELSEPMAEQLQLELAGRVFLKVADYLGIDLERIISSEQPQTSGPDTMTIAPPAAVPAEDQVRGAQFFFSPEDEQEIRELTKKTIEVPQEANTENLEDRIVKIIEKAEINFGSEDLTNRFKLILRTYLRGIRTRLDTKLTLTKGFESGGLGFDSDSAEGVLALADQSEKLLAAEPLKKPPAIAVPEDRQVAAAAGGQKQDLAQLQAIGARDIEYDLAKELAKKEQAGAANQEAPTAEAPKEQPLAPPPLPVADTIIIKRPPETGNKVKMEDIKYVPKSMGPTDELQYFDLASLRRLDKEPAAATAKILSKIKLLEEESYGRRLEGIKAWRQSPVNKLYLSIGEQAMAKNQPIEIIIEERNTAGEETLTGEEFEAIMALNKNIRY